MPSPEVAANDLLGDLDCSRWGRCLSVAGRCLNCATMRKWPRGVPARASVPIVTGKRDPKTTGLANHDPSLIGVVAAASDNPTLADSSWQSTPWRLAVDS